MAFNFVKIWYWSMKDNKYFMKNTRSKLFDLFEISCFITNSFIKRIRQKIGYLLKTCMYWLFSPKIWTGATLSNSPSWLAAWLGWLLSRSVESSCDLFEMNFLHFRERWKQSSELDQYFCPRTNCWKKIFYNILLVKL